MGINKPSSQKKDGCNPTSGIGLNNQLPLRNISPTHSNTTQLIPILSLRKSPCILAVPKLRHNAYLRFLARCTEGARIRDIDVPCIPSSSTSASTNMMKRETIIFPTIDAVHHKQEKRGTGMTMPFK